MQVVEGLVAALVVAGMVALYFRLKAQEALLTKSTEVLTQLVNVVGSYPDREIQYLQKQAERLQSEILAVKSPAAFAKVHGKPEPPEVPTWRFQSMGESFEMPPGFDSGGE